MIKLVVSFKGRHKHGTSYRTKSSYDRKINVRVRRNRYKLSYDRTTQHDEIRTIACGHFVRRTSVFYTRTILSYDSLCRCFWPCDSLCRPLKLLVQSSAHKRSLYGVKLYVCILQVLITVFNLSHIFLVLLIIF